MNNKGNNISTHCEGPGHRLKETELRAEAKYPINFTQSGKRICIKSTLTWKQQFLIFQCSKNISFQSKGL